MCFSISISINSNSNTNGGAVKDEWNVRKHCSINITSIRRILPKPWHYILFFFFRPMFMARLLLLFFRYHFVTSSFSPSLILSSGPLILRLLVPCECEKADFCITLSNPFQCHISKITTFSNLCICIPLFQH